MIDFFYRVRFPIGCNKFGAILNKVLEICLNLYYPIYHRKATILDGLNNNKRDEKIIVSLTSYPKRFNKLHLCISTLLRQTLKPDKVILWLYSGECSLEQLPKELKELCKCGLEIRFCKENIKPHKKYYYSAKEFPDAVIITVDDDIFYPTWLVERLYAAHCKDTKNIICTVSRKIHFKEGGVIAPYLEWDKLRINSDEISHLRVAIGCGGVLYPANCMDTEYFNIDKLTQLALETDDLWVKFAQIRSDRQVHVIEQNKFYPIPVFSSQKSALKFSNLGEDRNDINFSKLVMEYPICMNVLMNKL